METMLRDLRIGVRTLRRSGMFTATVIATLAVGIGANVAMFGTIDAAFFRPLPFEDPERLVLGLTTFSGRVNPVGSSEDYYDYRNQADSYEALAAYLPFPMSQPVTGGDVPEMVATQYVDWQYFRTLGVRPALGRAFNRDESADNGSDVAILSHGYWQRRFGGDPGAVGQVLTVGGRPYTVIGVMPAGFYLSVNADVWLAMRPTGAYAGVRRFHNWLMIGRLADGVSPRTAQSEADLIYAQLAEAYPDSNTDKGLRITPLREWLLTGSRQGLLLLWGAIGLVLLIACANVAGLLLARGSTRQTELAVRAALGASRRRLVGGLFAESALLAAAGGAGGLVLAGVFGRLIARFLPLDLPGGPAPGLSLQVIVFALALTVGTGLLFGALPALRNSRTDVADDLRSGRRSAGERGSARLRSGLVIGQVALSVLLLVGSGLLIRSFARISGVDPGFDPRNVLTGEIRLPSSTYPSGDERTPFFQALLERVKELPGVESATAISALPVANPGNNVTAYAVERPPVEPGDAPLAYQRVMLPGYFETMGIPLLVGRSIAETDDANAPRVMVVNEALGRRLFPDGSPLGRLVAADLGGDEPVPFEVVGVVADATINDLSRQPEPAMYFSYPQRPYTIMRLAIRTRSDPTALTGPVRAAVQEIDPDIPLAAVSTMESVLSGSVSNYRVMATALSLFAAAAMILAAMGLYGVLALYVSRRVHEIGIRVALGADVSRVLRGVVQRGLGLVVVGLALGIAAALGTTRLLSQMLYGVEPSDPTTFAAVGVFFVLVACLASLVPGWRAARTDPMEAFRAE